MAVAALLAIAFLAASLFLRQAVEHQRVQHDLDLAAEAFAGARGAGARELAPDNWQLATTRMDEAMAELHRQDARFVLIRSYPKAHELLAKAIDAAEIAKTTADTARTAAEEQGQHHPGTAVPSNWAQMISAPSNDQAGAAVEAAMASVNNLAGLLARIEGCPRARRAREIRNDLEVVKRNLVAYRREFDEVQGKFARGEMAAAKLQADTLRGRADPSCKVLENIRTKFKCR